MYVVKSIFRQMQGCRACRQLAERVLGFCTFYAECANTFYKAYQSAQSSFSQVSWTATVLSIPKD